MVKHHCIQCSKKCVGDVLKIGEKYFHQKCFRCKDCNSNIDTGGYYVRDGKYYCPKDYYARFKKKCFACSQFIESEIISVLNIHFHINCFKCSSCGDVFSPGDRVTMTDNRFICEICNSYQEIDLKNIPMQHSSGPKHTETLFNKDKSFDEIQTDQGYSSGDPMTLSTPISHTEEEKQSHCPSNSSTEKTKSHLSLNDRLFDFGKFYKTSYLEIQKRREKESFKKKTTRPSSLKGSYHFHLPIKDNHYFKRQSQFCKVKNILMTSEADIIEKENIIRLSSYSAGEKRPNDSSIPIERDDWPAPPSYDVKLRDKGLRNTDLYDSPIRCQSMYNPGELVDYSTDTQCRSLSEVFKDIPRNYSNMLLDNEVISSSRFPNASKEPSSKLRYKNHKDKSKSRDSTYFNDIERHKGYSLEFLSSTTRPFLAGSIPHELYGSKVIRNNSIVCPNFKPGYTQGLLYDMKIKRSRETLSKERNNNNICNHERLNNASVYSKNGYDSTFEEAHNKNKNYLTHLERDLHKNLKISKNTLREESMKDQSSLFDKLNIKDKEASIESRSLLIQKPVQITKSHVVSYLDILSKDPKIMKYLDKTKLETYLSAAEFQHLFNLTKSAFYKLPEWKRNDLKKRVNLF